MKLVRALSIRNSIRTLTLRMIHALPALGTPASEICKDRGDENCNKSQKM